MMHISPLELRSKISLGKGYDHKIVQRTKLKELWSRTKPIVKHL
jgi:hypothetical protein